LFAQLGRIEALLAGGDFTEAPSAVQRLIDEAPPGEVVDYQLTGGIYVLQSGWNAARTGELLTAHQRLQQGLALMRDAMSHTTDKPD
jgi:hypothetical protein